MKKELILTDYVGGKPFVFSFRLSLCDLDRLHRKEKVTLHLKGKKYEIKQK